MSRDSGVTFDHVRRACYEILSRGERPSRPSVQELLATDRYIGRKGGNELVQNLINDFWTSMSKTLQVPERTVDGVPAAFVPVIDKALGDMVAIARQIATDELADRTAALDARTREIQDSIQEARDAALAADQLRVRAEGELSAVQARANELRVSLNEAERKLADESGKVAAHLKTIDEKDAELRRQFASLEAANRALEQANEQHRQETHRLMQQLDNERQATRKETQRLTDQLERSREETAAVRKESATLREDVGRLRAENAAGAASRNALEESLRDAKARLDDATAKLHDAQQEATGMRVRYETAEQHRKEAVSRCTSQAEELGELRKAVEQLEADLAEYRKGKREKGSPKGE